MTFWDFIEKHGTKVLAVGQGSVAALCGIAGLIPEAHMKYWLAASALLTLWRGFENSSNQNAKVPVPFVPPPEKPK